MPPHGKLLVGMFVLALVVRTTSVSAQSPPTQPPPPPPPPAATDQEVIVAYWTSETGWTSELQLRNNGLSQPLTVTPVLRIADGAETSLAPVTIQSEEVASVDINAAIAAAAAPQLVGTYGSIALRFQAVSAAALYAAMMIHNMGHAIAFHIDATGESQDIQIGSREGIWWLPNDSASDYLILTNQGKSSLSLNLSLSDASGKQATQQVLLGPAETSRFSTRKLILASGLTGSYGGIKISTTAHAGSLDSLHFLFDETPGFSATLKMFDYDPNATLAERDYARTGIWTLRAPMLALSSPDPALALPPGTALQPQLFIRNTTGKTLTASLRFNWRNATNTGAAPGPSLTLNPYETRRIDVAALQAGGTLPKDANWASVTLTTNGLPDELIAVAASYDQTLQYGAQTPFSDQLSFRWEGGMWQYDAYHDSIITAGNGGAKPTQSAFTIFYDQGTQRYDLEQTLQPDGQMWIDVGQLIREQVPDKNGKLLPPGLTYGSYEFRDLTNTGIGSLFEGKVIYDKTYGHVAYGCAECCGFGETVPWYNPIGVPIYTAVANGVNALSSCTSTYDNVSESFYNNWASANTAIATVDKYGNHSGVSLGSTTSQTQGSIASPKIRVCPLLLRVPSGGVTAGSAPDHVSVVLDQEGYGPACPAGQNQIYLRQMLMQVVDIGGNALGYNPPISEAYNPSQPANSCPGGGSPVPSSCMATGNPPCTSCGVGQFLDSMTVSKALCSSTIQTSSGCGFTLTSTWSVCGTPAKSLWTSTRVTLSNKVTVNGQATIYSPGTVFH